MGMEVSRCCAFAGVIVGKERKNVAAEGQLELF